MVEYVNRTNPRIRGVCSEKTWQKWNEPGSPVKGVFKRINKPPVARESVIVTPPEVNVETTKETADPEAEKPKRKRRSRKKSQDGDNNKSGEHSTTSR